MTEKEKYKHKLDLEWDKFEAKMDKQKNIPWSVKYGDEIFEAITGPYKGIDSFIKLIDYIQLNENK